MNPLQHALAAAASLVVACASAQQVPIVHPKNADQHLQPGDVLFKLVGTQSPATSWGIGLTQTMEKDFYSAWNGAAAKGDGKAVHNVVYVGNGQFAEAYGKDNRVGMRSIDAHEGFFFLVYRPAGAAWARDAAQIARTWANGKMTYKDPFHVPFRSSSWGPVAKADAVRYGSGARRAGGPGGDTSMFCSEFAIAVYQAAAVSHEMSKGNVNPGNVQVPYSVQLDASNTSPLVLNGRLEEAVRRGEWRKAGVVLVRSAPPGERTAQTVPAGFAWMTVKDGKLPADTVFSAEGKPVCRVKYEGGVHPGRGEGSNCNIGYGGREIGVGGAEVLVAKPAKFAWVPASASASLPANALIGGAGGGQDLAVCRAKYENVLYGGKVYAGNCNVGLAGTELTLKSYEVLVNR